MLILLAVPILALQLCYIYILVRRTDIGLISVVFANTLVLIIGEPQAVVGGFHLSGTDTIYICCLVAGVIRISQRAKMLTFSRAMAFGFLALFAFSLLRGFAANGIATTSNEARGFVGPLLAVLYFLDVDVGERSVRRYVHIYMAFGTILCIIAVLAALGVPVGSTKLPWATAGDVNSRFVPADSAGAIGVCWLFSLSVYQFRKRGLALQLGSVAFLVFAIYMRHRTVWVMLLAATMSLIFIDGRIFRRIVPIVLVAAIFVGGLAIYGSAHFEGASESDFSESASNAQTFQWRVNSWVQLFYDPDQTLSTVMIGKSIGSGYWRIDPETDLPITVAPHNEFVQDYLRVGAIGVLCLFAFSVRPILLLWRTKRSSLFDVYPSSSAWALVSFAALVFSITYSLAPHQYALIGIANAVASRIKQDEGSELSIDKTSEWDNSSLSSVAD
jgi:hypothetical protein